MYMSTYISQRHVIYPVNTSSNKKVPQFFTAKIKTPDSKNLMSYPIQYLPAVGIHA